MQLKVRLFAGLRERAGASEIRVDDLPDRATGVELKRALEALHPSLGSLAHVRLAVGTNYVRDEAPLADGDEVALIPPVSGGAPSDDERLAHGVFELCESALDPAACQRRVEHASCGAVVLFSGLVRATSRGQRVRHLEYEAHAALAGPEMGRIFERCRAQFGDPTGTKPERALRVLCQHRVGKVEIGEPSVVIAVASPHRALAFQACAYLIDELKSSLPVWKKELYEGGAEWIGDRS
jgi:molybdopterin synthase catalytic subunit